MARLTELSSQASGRRDAAFSPASVWTTVRNQRPLVSRSDEQQYSLPALSSLNLPKLVPRSLSNVITKDGLNCRTLAPARQEVYVKTTENPEDNDWEKKTTCLSKLFPQHTVNYGTSKLLAELSVEPTPSNAQLFHICKISHNSTEDRT
jgi:hypothetical protein